VLVRLSGKTELKVAMGDFGRLPCLLTSLTAAAGLGAATWRWREAYVRLPQPALAVQVPRTGLAARPDSPELRDRLLRSSH